MSFSQPDALSPQEIEQLIRVFLQGRTIVSEDECLLVMEWARRVRMETVLLALVLEGKVRPVVGNGAIKFTNIE